MKKDTVGQMGGGAWLFSVLKEAARQRRHREPV